MAYLLGNESCIESLRCDLIDIQQTIDDILARVGHAKCYSWKFPDKMAADLKVDELLGIYKYGRDETHNQVTHYSLLELIIDRLVLLVHLSNMQIEKCLNFNDTGKESASSKPSSATLPNNLSAGLAIKKYWSKFTHLCSTTRQLYGQNKALAKQKDESGQKVAAVGKVPSTQSNGKQLVTPTISDDVSNKNTQTIETAFVPCESCHKVQTNLKQNADSLLNILHYQNIPSSLAKFRASFPSASHAIGWLNANDMQQWLNEQDKDLNKIAKHTEFLSKNNEILKAKISELDASIAKLNDDKRDIKTKLAEEEGIKMTLMSQYEKKLADQKVDLANQISNRDGQISALNKTKANLDSQIASLNDIKKENEKAIVALNETINKLNSDLTVKLADNEKIHKVEQEKAVLAAELECKKQELSDKTKELNKERQKLENSIRHEQSLQSKQESLIASLDQITQECDALRNQLNSIESDKDGFEEQYKKILQELKQKDAKLKDYEAERQELNKNIDDLKTNLTQLNINLKKLKEKELLLMQYPDLYGPMPAHQETDLITDMESQMQANKYRIELLEAQNETLRIAIQRLIKINTTTTTVVESPPPTLPQNDAKVGRPVPLFKLENEIVDEPPKQQQLYTWNQNESIPQQYTRQIEVVYADSIFLTTTASEHNTPSSTEDQRLVDNHHHHQQQQMYISNGNNSTRRNSYSSHSNRHHSGSRNSNNNIPISQPVKDMEVVIGRGHRPNSSASSARPTSGAAGGVVTKRPPSSSGSNRSATTPKKDDSNKYYCERCYKTYAIRRDLDIHKMYCNR